MTTPDLQALIEMSDDVLCDVLEMDVMQAVKIIRQLTTAPTLPGAGGGEDVLRKAYEPDEYEDAFKGRDLKAVMDLAEGIWRIHFAGQAPNWRPETTIAGCVSQISNMVVGLDRNHRVQSRLEPNDSWLPIESAPKDRMILIVGGTWSGGNYDDMPQKVAATAYWYRDHWRGEDLPAHDEWRQHQPTHWQPLPAAPAALPPQQGG